jgi:hypothetical protein
MLAAVDKSMWDMMAHAPPLLHTYPPTTRPSPRGKIKRLQKGGTITRSFFAICCTQHVNSQRVGVLLGANSPASKLPTWRAHLDRATALLFETRARCGVSRSPHTGPPCSVSPSSVPSRASKHNLSSTIRSYNASCIPRLAGVFGSPQRRLARSSTCSAVCTCVANLMRPTRATHGVSVIFL